MNWYKIAKSSNIQTVQLIKTAQSLFDTGYWAKLNNLKEIARKNYIQKHAELSSDDKETILAGHGVYKGKCGHMISQCRCSHGSNFVFEIPTNCEKCR